jgi:hypothetical protein
MSVSGQARIVRDRRSKALGTGCRTREIPSLDRGCNRQEMRVNLEGENPNASLDLVVFAMACVAYGI